MQLGQVSPRHRAMSGLVYFVTIVFAEEVSLSLLLNFALLFELDNRFDFDDHALFCLVWEVIWNLSHLFVKWVSLRFVFVLSVF